MKLFCFLFFSLSFLFSVSPTVSFELAVPPFSPDISRSVAIPERAASDQEKVIKPTTEPEGVRAEKKIESNTPADEQRVYLYKDALGSTALVLDQSGNFVARYKYDPFGAEEYSEEVKGFGETTHRHTGHELDPESELGYAINRYHDYFTGAWISKDRIAGHLTDPQSLNRYTYVQNNPLDHVDKDGNQRSLKRDMKLAKSFEPLVKEGIEYLEKHGPKLIAKGKGELSTAVEKIKGGTYKLIDTLTELVRRTGRSKDLDKRKSDHKRDEKTKDLDFVVDKRTDNYAEQRGREKAIFDENPQADLNKIKPVSDKNKNKQIYIDAEKTRSERDDSKK